MYVYIFADLLMLAFVLMSRRASNKRCDLILGISCVIWALIFGLRGHRVGNDTPAYAGFFECTNAPWSGYGTYNAPGETIEYGFVFINRVLAQFSDSATFFFLFHACFLFTILYYVYKKSTIPVMSFLWLMTFGSMIVTLMVATRQSFAICFILFSIVLISKAKIKGNILKKKQYLNTYFLLALLSLWFSISIHRSTIVFLLLLVYLYYIKFNKIVIYVLLLSSVIIALFYHTIIADLFETGLLYINIIKNNNTDLLSTRYVDNMSGQSASFIRYLSLVIPACVTTYLSNIKKIESFPFKCMIFGVICYVLFSSSVIISRMVAIFIVIGYSAIIPDNVKERKIFIFYALATLYHCWRAIVGFFQDASSLQNTYILYKFFWQ